MVGDLAPFVEVGFTDKDGRERIGLFLLDSGSTTNLLSCDMLDQIGALCELEKGTRILSIAHDFYNAKNVRFSFALGGKQFTDIFSVSRESLPVKVKGMDFLGILGISFLIQHELVIDYHDYTLHTSDVSPENLSTSDCDFFFPMGIGLQFYNLPVLPVSQDGIELVTLVDTGSTNNMIAEQALNDCGFDYERTAGEDVMQGVIGQIEVKEAMVSFNILSLLDDDFVKLCRKELFSIMPCNVFTPKEGQCDTNGEQLPPIEMLIGSPFMAKERWILDFGAQIIYRRKCSDHLKEAV